MRGEPEAQFWIGCFHQVVRDDNVADVPPLTVASEPARKTGDELTLSYALRHLGIAAHMAGDLNDARALADEAAELAASAGAATISAQIEAARSRI